MVIAVAPVVFVNACTAAEPSLAAIARFACLVAASEEVVMFEGEAAFETPMACAADVLDAASAASTCC